MKIVLIICGVLLSACATTQFSKHPITFEAMEYNSVYSNYYPKATFAEIAHKEKGDSWLIIEMISYNKKAPNQNYFLKSQCDTYIKYIDKYIEWESIARSNNDIVEKQIGKAKSVLFDVEFRFFSGNQHSHLLAIDNQYFDKESTLKLRELLVEFRDDKIKPQNTNLYK
jgi:hypothetical protein